MGDDPKCQLSLDSLGELLEAIFSANLKWYNLGLRLGLPVSKLDAINTQCHQDPEVCLREMLKEWLKKDSPESPWEELTAALASTAVGEQGLAGRLRTRYCSGRRTVRTDAKQTPSEQQSDDVFTSSTSGLESATNKRFSNEVLPNEEFSPETPHKPTMFSSASYSDQHSSDTTNNTSNTTNNNTQKTRRAFGCGCGKCSLTTFLDGGCPEPIKSLTSFPHLQTQDLTPSEAMILKGRLYNEFQLMTRRFSKFNSTICESLIERDVTVKSLARVLRDLRAFRPSESEAPLLRDRFDEIKAARDVDDVFDILADYVCFFSFHITEHVVESLGTEKDRRLLAEYKDELDGYCKRNIFECPSYSIQRQQDVANLVVKVEGIEKYNMKHLAEFISDVSKVLAVSQHTLQLCSVERGCVQLSLQTPHFVKDKVFPLAEGRREELEEMGVVLVRCEEWEYKLSAVAEDDELKAEHTTTTTSQPDPQDNSYRRLKADSTADVPSTESSYSHGALSRQESERRLTGVHYDCFLLRESESQRGHLTLSVRQKGEINHVLVKCTEAGYMPQGEVEPFRTIESFISHISGYLPLCPKPSSAAAKEREREGEGSTAAADPDATLTRTNSAQLRVDRRSSGAGDDPCLSDYGSTTDFSGGDNTGDWTGGTGDSGVMLLPLHLPPPVPPKSTRSHYEKLRSDKRDGEHQYSRVRQPYASLVLDRSQHAPSPLLQQSSPTVFLPEQAPPTTATPLPPPMPPQNSSSSKGAFRPPPVPKKRRRQRPQSEKDTEYENVPSIHLLPPPSS